MRNLPEVTGMRGFAAFYVLLLHILVVFPAANPAAKGGAFLFNFGWIGVDFFFVLSGFLLALPLLARPQQVAAPGFWRTYLAKRWWRIAPPYYLSILLALLFAGNLPYVVRAPSDMALHLAFLHSFRLESLVTIDPVYWTLATEFQFYLILPVFSLLLARRSWPITLGLLSASTVAWRAATYHGLAGASWLSFTLPAFLIHFALGILAARVFLSGWKPPVRAYIGAPIVVGAFIVLPLNFLGAVLNQGDSSFVANLVLRPLLAIGFSGLILVVCSEASLLKRAFSSKPMQLLGESSYSLYLTHVPLLYLLNKSSNLVAGGFWNYFIIAMIACLGLGGLFYALIEKPSLALRAWMVRRQTRPTPTGTVRQPSVIYASTVMAVAPSPDA